MVKYNFFLKIISEIRNLMDMFKINLKENIFINKIISNHNFEL